MEEQKEEIKNLRIEKNKKTVKGANDFLDKNKIKKNE